MTTSPLPLPRPLPLPMVLLLVLVVLRRRKRGGELDRPQHRGAALLPACGRCSLFAAASNERERTPSTDGRSWWRSRRRARRSSSPPTCRDRDRAGVRYARLRSCRLHPPPHHPCDDRRGHSFACSCHFFSSTTRSGSPSREPGREPTHSSVGFVERRHWRDGGIETSTPAYVGI